MLFLGGNLGICVAWCFIAWLFCLLDSHITCFGCGNFPQALRGFMSSRRLMPTSRRPCRQNADELYWIWLDYLWFDVTAQKTVTGQKKTLAMPFSTVSSSVTNWLRGQDLMTCTRMPQAAIAARTQAFLLQASQSTHVIEKRKQPPYGDCFHFWQIRPKKIS